MKCRKIFIANFVITIVQVMLLVPSFILQYFSEEKMGVMRYLVFKNRIYEQTIFSPDLIHKYNIFLYMLLGINIVLLFYAINKLRNRRVSKIFISAIIIDILTIFFMTYKNFKMLNAFYFFLISLFLINLLQYMKIIITYVFTRCRNCL